MSIEEILRKEIEDLKSQVKNLIEANKILEDRIVVLQRNTLITPVNELENNCCNLQVGVF